MRTTPRCDEPCCEAAERGDQSWVSKSAGLVSTAHWPRRSRASPSMAGRKYRACVDHPIGGRQAGVECRTGVEPRIRPSLMVNVRHQRICASSTANAADDAGRYMFDVIHQGDRIGRGRMRWNRQQEVSATAESRRSRALASSKSRSQARAGCGYTAGRPACAQSRHRHLDRR